MLSLRNVTREYALDEDTAITPVRDVSLNVEAGAFVIVVGRSGSGKTTLLNLLAGLVKPSSGSVVLDGIDLAGMTDGQLSSLRADKLGFVFQFPSLLPALTALENVAMPATFACREKRAGASERAAALLQRVGLSERLSAYPRQLSAGEQKRVVLARSLVNSPRLLLADEPTSDLDEQTEGEIMDLLKGANRDGVTIVMVTHSRELLGHATHALRMDRGTLTDLGREALSAGAAGL